VLPYPLSVMCNSVSCPCLLAGNIPWVLPARLLSSSGMDMYPCGCWGGSAVWN